ncbi:FtsX-like permease family protein [Cellulomonas fengjieae]|uniref:ABC3 transporter permease C-terminal domain-containing protein n=1 Tax=Cellulomonas fengjieae TaxID=2819978 RepID=A0ABS3SL67_9CELL|nr:FtsX-like permease family protein [Cellulomonas fengjieae]MBO3086491.1 hypothetical protein [Cellulomonas fengjieae]QVI66646.1 hypothetical protein KG102_03340 [Cellulomonas fengjieae]
MGWSLRVLRHRAGAQRVLVATVVAVALVGSSLLGTFALLLFTSEHRALDMALDQAPAAATEIDVDLSLLNTRPDDAVAAGGEFLDELLADVPAERSTWLTSPLYRLTGEDGSIKPLAYQASYPVIPSHATLLEGEWPTTSADAAGRVQVSVPKVAADEYGWTVGTELPVQNLDTYDESAVVVVGVHELAGPSTLWTRDLLVGAEHDPNHPIPNSFGLMTTDAWGPFVVAPDALTESATVAMATLVASPELTGSPPGAVTALRERLQDAQPSLLSATDSFTVSSIFGSRLAPTIDEAMNALAVTRVSLVIVGLMLVVLAVTVLLLAARLLADRRAPEQTLMASRGASGRQLLGLAALESAGVALVTTLVSPWLAVLLFQAITAAGPLARAGLHHDPGRPPVLWITCAAASFVLSCVLLGPLLRRRGSVVDAEQQLVRQDRRGGLARSGADLALLVVAGVAIWQLSSYRSPVAATGPARLDPVLVAAPALLLLAGAVLALRLLPVITGAGERLAARSRSLVWPLAAWEVRRRPGRAAGAVLLLTLALAVGSFSQSFLSTWRMSQAEQADLALGTDVRLDRLEGSAIEQTAAVAGLPDVEHASGVTNRSVALGPPSVGGARGRTASANLLAVDTTLADELLRGRISPDWAALTEPLHPAGPTAGLELPGSPTGLLVDVEGVTGDEVVGSLLVTLVVEDAMSNRVGLNLSEVPLDEQVTDVSVPLPPGSQGLRLVGVVGQVLSAIEGGGEAVSARERVLVDVSISLRNLRVVESEAITPVPLDSPEWTVRGRPGQVGGGAVFSVVPDGEGLHLRALIPYVDLLFEATGFAAVTHPDPGPMPVLATDTLLSSVSGEVGDEFELDLGGTLVPVVIQREVPYLPGLPRGSGLLVDRETLARAALLQSWTATLLDEWWLEVPDEHAPGLIDHLEQAGLGVSESRAVQRGEATDGPLRISVQAALWIVTFAAVALAVAGFAMSATVAVRTRRLELARLQALGSARSGLVRSVLVEHAILGVLGLLAGLALGALLGRVVAPLVTVAGDGRRPVPAVIVQWPWAVQLALVTVLLVLVGLAVATTTNALLRRASGELLRLGDER